MTAPTLTTLAQEIKATVPFPELFKELFPGHFRQAGNSACPFHEDSVPSLELYPDHAFCHGEKKRFDHFDLWKHAHGGDFKGAVKMLAQRAGLDSGNGNRSKPLRGARAAGKTKGRIVAAYAYTDESGTLLYQTVRYDPKDFRQRRPDGNGGWNWNLKDTRLVLYHLPEVVTADAVWLVEGERDADSLHKIGLCGTTAPMGAGKIPKLQKEHNILETLRGKHVIVCQDNDPPGKKHAQDTASSLTGFAASVKILELPGLDEKQDVSNFIEKHGPDEAKRLLLELAESTPEYSGPTPSRQTEQSNENCTDMGNARRLAARFGDRVRYCKQLGWMIFDGKRWVPDDCAQVQAFAKDVVRDIYHEAAQASDEDTRKRLARWALSCETAHRIQAMIQLFPSEPGISVTHDRFDQGKMLLNLPNGTLNLESGNVRTHNKTDLLTKLAPVRFDPKAECPRWERFVSEIMDSDAELTTFLQRLLGYGITGETREQVWAFLWGKGANGKSTLLETLSYVLGDYAMNTPAETFLENKPGSIRNDLARLRGARIVTASEPRVGRFDHAIINSFTGEDQLSVRFLHKEHFDFQPEALLCFAANHRPNVKDTSLAFWRRLLLLPFVRQFTNEERDPALRAALRAEASGILNWLVAGCLEWQRSGLMPPVKVREAVNEYRCETDVLGDFIETCCVVAVGTQVPRQALFDAYQRFCEERSIRKPLSQRAFNESILTREGVFHQRLGANKVHTWRGIGLRAPDVAPSQCASGKSRQCGDCDFERCCPVESSRRDADLCKNYKPCGV
jgi:putative DNA primase/helicase